jgi:hypothetical protein
MSGILWFFVILGLCQGTIPPNMQHIQRLFESIKHAKNVGELVKNLPPTLAEYLLASISPKHQKPKKSSYDFVVDLTHPTDIYDTLKSYPLSFPLGKEVYDNKTKDQYNRFIVNVVGRYNVGKTYVLRLLAGINLGHSFTERTNGISVSLPSLEITNKVPIALIDTAGTRVPVEFNTKTFHKLSYEKQISDSFVQEVAFNSAEIFILVLSQLTLDDELYLKTLYKRLKENGHKDEDIKQRLLIVHNYLNLKTVQEVESVEETELKGIFNAYKQPQGYWLSENFKHFVIANSDSKAGKHYNRRTIEQINTMILGSQASTEPDVLSRIIREIEKLLSKFLIEQSQTTVSLQSNEDDIGGYVAAVIGRDHNQQHRIELTDKRNIHVKLKVEEFALGESHILYFICPQTPLSDTIILSKNLKFNEDGSVYIDYSSQFIPDMQVSIVNTKGDIVIKIECPSCSPKFVVGTRKTSIVVRAEKIQDVALKDYINTRRTGKFEVEIPIGKLDDDRVFDFRLVKQHFENGVIIIKVPALSDEF